jgi:type 1 glutamine amidotransferase
MIRRTYPKLHFPLVLLLCGCFCTLFSAPDFKLMIWATTDPWHFQINSAKAYIQELGKQYNFQADFFDDVNKHTEATLSQYDLYFNLNLEVTPFNDQQKQAFEKFIKSGKGWVCVHKGGINKGTWPWFDAFMGGTRFNDHPYWEHALMKVEDTTHPATKTLPSTLYVWDECFQFTPTPTNVRVLASLDEKTYTPKNPMGYHPIIWCNEKYPNTLYIGIGHSDSMWTREQNFRRLVRDAILWAGRGTTKAKTLSAPTVHGRLGLRITPRDVSLCLPAKQFEAMVHDAAGRMVATYTTSNGICRFDRAGFSSGVYFVQVTDGAYRIRERIVLP